MSGCICQGAKIGCSKVGDAVATEGAVISDRAVATRYFEKESMQTNMYRSLTLPPDICGRTFEIFGRNKRNTSIPPPRGCLVQL
uniref:Uncharacterized protein n=1 Tax=Acrobeloides nanus TaxID=290746 RepID=A0A914E2A3_9BILA